MAVVYSDNFDTGPSGAQLTTTNSCFSLFSTTKVWTFQPTNKRSGTLAAACTGSVANAYAQVAFTATSTHYVRFYFAAGLPSGIIGIMAGLSTGSNRWRVQLTTSGQLTLLNNTTVVATSSSNVCNGAVWRIEIDLSSTAITARMYGSANRETTTPTETITGSYTSGTFNQIRYGLPVNASAVSATWYMDDLVGDDAAAPGPAAPVVLGPFAWTGDGLAAGALTTSSAGTGDTPFNSLGNSALLSIENAGPRPPRIRLATTGTGNVYTVWSYATLGTLATYGIREYFYFDTAPTAQTSLLTGANASTAAWRVDVAATSGSPASSLRLRNNSAQLAASSQALTGGKLYRLEVVGNGAAVTATVYDGHTSTVSAGPISGTASTAAIDNIRFGHFVNTTMPTWYIDDLAVAAGATEIGPSEAPPVETGYTWKEWNGTTETALTMAGEWNGTTTVPLSSTITEA